MDFGLSADQLALIEAVERTCAPFDDEYWSRCEEEHRFPHEFYAAFADGGWIGIAMPEEFGGAGLGITEAALLMLTVSRMGGAMAAASSIHINIFGPHPIVVHGTQEQKERWLPPIIQGREKTCFGITEPDAGLDTGRIKTKAERTSDGYVINGQKIWTSTAQVADNILILARTTPREECEKSIDGLSLFYTKLDRERIEVRRIEKMGRAAVDSNQIFIDNLHVDRDALIGEEGKGFRALLHGLNPERIINAVESIGIGRDALARATQYAKDRIVFDRPIGQNQSVAHPLARSWVELEAAYLMAMRAATLYDRGESCGLEANAAKLLGSEAGFNAAHQSFMTLGGMGYAKEYQIERLLREVIIARTAPVSTNMVLNFISERALGLPRSY
ncbi:MAG: acyl-CoA/acyl-ACP dehydrogenase [Candidatus Andeanibacterium colombiense]|uniref:Acyl-CoA/acyl-ACP dehydrogenase n=1 Tax=Candidatus Andeanibacterium colombiense TaxID=3121345 RepID=A0AAJ5X826_9SPHN|nr:MAG: acyl-CoA/acyl-ACP dehydrogenase [Sphingomonadaceae bacterium]